MEQRMVPLRIAESQKLNGELGRLDTKRKEAGEMSD